MSHVRLARLGVGRARRRTESPPAALFWAPMMAAALWILWWPPRTVDGPAHLLGARVLADHDTAPYATLYDLDLSPTPNLAGTLLLAGLTEVGSLRFAETTVLVLAGLGLPLASRYAIGAVDPAAGWLAIAALPLSFGYLYFYGFYNYCLASALAVLTVGWLLRVAPGWGWPASAGLTALLTLTWLTHLVPFLAAATVLLVVLLRGPRARRCWLPGLASLGPAALLSMVYLAGSDGAGGPSWAGAGGRVIGLLSLHTPITTFSRLEDLIAALLALTLVVLGVGAGRRAGPDAARSVGWTALVLAGLVLVVPTRLGPEFGLIDERLAVFPVLFGLIWLAGRAPRGRVATGTAIVLVLVSVALAAVRIPELRRYDRLADEYASAGRFVERGAVVLALRLHSYGPDAGRNSAWDPVTHLSSRLAAERGGVDIGHYEAVLDYFPARFAPEANARRVIDPDLTGLQMVPPRVDLDVAAVRAVLGPDIALYVLVVGATDVTGAAAPEAARLRGLLNAQLEPVGTTAPRGLVEVWRAPRS